LTDLSVGNDEPELDKGNIHETVLDLISDNQKGRLLDVGAGSGGLSLRLRRMGFDVIGADIESNFKAKNIDKGIEFVLCDLSKGLSFKNDVFEHIENPWYFLRELSRILKVGGKLYLTTPNVHSIHQRIYFLFNKQFYFFDQGDFEQNRHLNPMLFWNLERMLLSAGFGIKKITFNRAFIPLIKIGKRNLGAPKSFMFGENLIAVAKKKEVVKTKGPIKP